MKKVPSRKKRVRNWIQKYVIPQLAASVGQVMLHLLLFTCRFRIEGIEELKKHADRGGFFIMIWHERIAIILHVLLRTARQYYYAAVVSNSRDGDILTAIANRYRHGKTIKVAHNARHHAVRAMIHELKAGTIVMITPDGPKGPRYTIRPGIAFAAAEAGVPVLPFTWRASRYWQLPTWDKMKFPKPFSRIDVQFGPAVEVGPGAERGEVEMRLQEAMNRSNTAVEARATYLRQ